MSEATLLTAGIAAASRAMNAANLAKGGGPKYKKAPDAPKRFKSAFIIFSAEKHKEIKDNLIQQGRTEKVGAYLIGVGFYYVLYLYSFVFVNVYRVRHG